MHILFMDFHTYSTDALNTMPLGGSQSALLMAAQELKKSGAAVTIAGQWSAESEHQGVRFVNFSHLDDNALLEIDVVVTLNRLISPKDFYGRFKHRPRLVHWHQNDTQSPYGKNFANREFYAHVDHFVFVSHFQAGGFLSRYGLPCDRVSVIPNPISEPFCDLFADNQPILQHKDPDLLVYISAPNRGLEGLLTVAFPHLRRLRPALRLEVYSGFYFDQGMGYVIDGKDSSAHYENLLREHHSPPTVTVHRGVPKSELARKLQKAAMLCYPCIYSETSCIAVLEAMAAGCLISTSTMGALPETTAGFAWLTPRRPKTGLLADEFRKTTLSALSMLETQPQELEKKLRNQITHVNQNHGPRITGRRWLALLRDEIDRRQTGP